MVDCGGDGMVYIVKMYAIACEGIVLTEKYAIVIRIGDNSLSIEIHDKKE